MTTTTEVGALLPVDDAGVAAVTAVAHLPEAAALPPVLLLPGAGGDLHGDGLVALAEVLSAGGAPVVRANLPYREAGRRPPRADRSVRGLVQVASAARDLLAQHGVTGPLVLGGKSYGGRVASMAVAADAVDEVLALLFYGYPLHPPGRADQLRVDHWPDVGVPCCFVQGSRDPFGTPDELTPHLRRLPRRATVVAVDGGDHSLRVTRASSPDGVARGEGAILRGEVGQLVLGWLGHYGSW